MTDFSEGPFGALGRRGREPEERMRLFLDCEKADGSGHDFKKGSVKFEYKHSRLITRNVRSKKQRRLHHTKSWYFAGGAYVPTFFIGMYAPWLSV